MPTVNDPIWQLPPVTRHEMLLADEALATLPWHIANYKIDQLLWPLVKNVQKKVKVCVLDTGVSKTHCDKGQLIGQVVKVVDFTNSRNGPWDQNGHGSHTAGIIGALDFGLANYCVELICAKVLGDDGVGYDSNIGSGIRWALKEGAAIISMSLGSQTLSPTIGAALLDFVAQGGLVVAAAGNDGGPVGQPAAQPYCLATSATDEQNKLADFSDRGWEIDVCAPGVKIRSLAPGGSYAVMSGTSMSCPWAAAYLAVKLAYDLNHNLPPIRTIEQTLDWLKTDTIDLGEPGLDPLYGFGLPDPAKFVAVAPPVLPPIIPIPVPPVQDSINVQMQLDNGRKYAGKLIATA